MPGEKQSSNVELRFSVVNGTSFVGASRSLPLTAGGKGIGSTGKRYRMCTGMSCRGRWRRIYGFGELKNIVSVEVWDSLLHGVL